ncbi:hypothetical protein AXG93_1520s1290 [Marchantia polymorpha subsp. ruderalis]|uniref:Uncharacterized protein n=1 Tax=Marchantia polymorpha subsp. ruderalis TaxID=1480154 RepID=A0A176VJ52_MARPO|nr:hypothetical protein AXG93_1520s1290 [Marchantia polymorpha subsp. ruderalis]
MMNAERSSFNCIPTAWHQLLTINPHLSKEEEWVGIFPDDNQLLPDAIFQATSDFQPFLSPSGTDLLIPASIQVYQMGMHSQALIAQLEHGPEPWPLHGWEWRPGEGFFSYIVKKGRTWRNPRLYLSLSIAVKWLGHVHPTFVSNWGKI